MEQEVVRNDENIEEMHLDDARRVKVLSPGMLVFKRFIRNSLAVIGFGILLFMFIFAFLGPLLSPYGQTQVLRVLAACPRNMQARFITRNYVIQSLRVRVSAALSARSSCWHLEKIKKPSLSVMTSIIMSAKVRMSIASCSSILLLK